MVIRSEATGRVDPVRQRRDHPDSPESLPLPGVRPPSARVVLTRFLRSKSVRRRLAASLVIVLLGWTAYLLAGRAVGWLHAQPEFTIPFEAVELVPEPPASLRDGRKAVFSRVRDRGKIDGPIRLLDQDLRELGLAFAKHSPWIAKVERVDRAYPRRIVVRVVYREPVARFDFAGDRFLAVANDGVVLPSEEIKASIAANLPRLKGFASPPQDLPGHYLGADRDGNVPPEITAAVALARYLHLADHGSEHSPGFSSVNLEQGASQLLVKTSRGMWVRWWNAPGEEQGDEPKAAEKLERFKRWEEKHPNEPFTEEDCLIFTGDSAELRHPKKPKG